MYAETAIYIFILLVVIGALGFVIIVADIAEERDAEAKCVENGCKEGNLYFGSKSKKEYLSCSCGTEIDREDLICFPNEEEANSQGYELKNC